MGDNNKLEIMQHNIQKMEDIKNSQIGLIEKISLILNDVMNNPDQELEDKLNEIYSNASNNEDLIKKTLEEYKMKYNEMKMTGS